jgi:hypothetical protein
MLSPFAAIKGRDREPNLNGGLASGASQSAWPGKATICNLRATPLVIPDLETSDVKLKGLPTQVHRDPFHQHLILREDRVATVAGFAVASTTPNLLDAVLWQVPVLEFASDDKTERFLVHRAAGEGGHRCRAGTPMPRNTGREGDPGSCSQRVSGLHSFSTELPSLVRPRRAPD